MKNILRRLGSLVVTALCFLCSGYWFEYYIQNYTNVDALIRESAQYALGGGIFLIFIGILTFVFGTVGGDEYE